MTSSRPVLVEVMLLGSGSRNLTRVGSGSRELDYYQRLSRCWEVRVFEYDDPESDWLNAGIGSVSRRFRHRVLHSTLGAWLAGRELRRAGVIRTKQFWGAWAGVLLSRASRRPLVIRMGYHWSYNFILERGIRSGVLIALIRGFERWILQFAHGLVFGSEAIARAFPSHTIPSMVAPNGIDPTRFFPATVPPSVDLIYVGRLLSVKGFDRLLPLLPRQRRICVIGSGPLQMLLASRPDVEHIPRIDNQRLADVLRSARCFVSMSRTEGSPKALLEAIFCGCYPILSDIGPHRSLLDELGYGFVLPDEATSDSMQKAVAQALVDSAKLKAFRSKYSIDRIVAAEMEFLERIAANV